MLRFITLIQTLWFIVNIISRASQGLAITALELSTSAFFMVRLATNLCWVEKPADIQNPEYVNTNTPLQDILLDGREEAAGVYYNTPLDFVSRQEWSWSILWAHGLNCLRKIHLAAQPVERPVTRIQNTIVPAIWGPGLRALLRCECRISWHLYRWLEFQLSNKKRDSTLANGYRHCAIQRACSGDIYAAILFMLPKAAEEAEVGCFPEWRIK